MIVINDDGSTVDINLDDREHKMLKLSLEYAKDPFGAPNDLLMKLVSKLWKYITLGD
jgi:hypothetical protein